MIFDSLNIPEMQRIARHIAGNLRKGDTITLSGEIGAGKTTFARALIERLSTVTTEITSPTFTIMQSYEVKLADDSQEILWHLDLYRLKNSAEAQELGLQELWPHITIIEWPELIARMLPADRLNIAFDFGKNRETRTLTVTGNEEWQSRLQNIRNIS